MQYDRSAHCVHCHRYRIVWSTKYRHGVLVGDLRLRVRAICRQVRRGNGVSILHGVLSSDHVHMVVSVPPKLAISDPVGGMKGRSSHRAQRGFPEIRGRGRGRRFRGRGLFPATAGTITDGPVLRYPGRHLPDATGASRLHSRHRSGDKSRGGCGTERLQSRSQHELG